MLKYFFNVTVDSMDSICFNQLTIFTIILCVKFVFKFKTSLFGATFSRQNLHCPGLSIESTIAQLAFVWLTVSIHPVPNPVCKQGSMADRLAQTVDIAVGLRSTQAQRIHDTLYRPHLSLQAAPWQGAVIVTRNANLCSSNATYT